MISYQEALTIIRDEVSPLGMTERSVLKCVGEICRESVQSPTQIPPFANSAMDGFALCSGRTHNASQQNPVRLSVGGSVAAGDHEQSVSGEEGCWEIMTGAPVPKGFDSVVMVEKVKRDGEFIEISEPVAQGQHIRYAGEDFQVGQNLLRFGEALSAEHVAILVSLGIEKVRVSRKPKVAILSTGKELVPLGQPLQSGQIRNSNGPFLEAVLSQENREVRNFGIVEDDPRAFLKCMDKVFAWSPDVVLSTGAVSVGKYDFVSSSLRDLGAKTLFHRVAIRPGKPILFAKFPGERNCLFWGIPGNPVSAAVGFRFFVEPSLRVLQAVAKEPIGTAVLTNSFKKPERLRCFFKAKVGLSQNSELQLQILIGQESFKLSPLIEANAWAILPEGKSEVSSGQKVSFVPLWPDQNFLEGAQS